MMTVGIKPCQTDPNRFVISPVSHCGQACISSTRGIASVLPPASCGVKAVEEEEVRRTMNKNSRLSDSPLCSL